MTDRPSFRLAAREERGATVVRIDGEVDLTNADEIQRSLEQAEAPVVVLDVSGLMYLDSSGIRAIEGAFRHLRSEAQSLLIVSPEETPAGWTFRVAGFDPDLLFESLDLALVTAARVAK